MVVWRKVVASAECLRLRLIVHRVFLGLGPARERKTAPAEQDAVHH